MENQQIFLNKAVFIQSRKERIIDFYDFEPKEIGRGAYGVVYKASPIGNPSLKRAIKKVSKKLLHSSCSLINQIETLKCLDHPGIVRLYQSFEDDRNLFLVLELCKGQQLFEYLQTNGGLSQSQARIIFRQIIETIYYCHQQKVAHRDLKPQNFIFSNPNSLTLKLIDFGLSFRWNKDMCQELIQKQQNKKIVGTSYYIAPQILTHKYDQRCDIWSAGVILYILITALPPFDGQTDAEIIQAIKKGVYTFNIPQMNRVSSSLKDLIKNILKPANQRISIQQIFNHPWMTQQLSNQHLKLNFKNIIDFTKFSKLKTIAATYIATQLPQNEIKKLGLLFKQIDINHDGYITIEQLKIALDNQKQNKQLQQLIKIVDFIDTDKNGKINYNQFVACNLQKQVLQNKQNLKNVFKMLDKDGNGVVQRSQLKQILLNNNSNNNNLNININSIKALDQIFKQCDTNGDGKIDFNQFIHSLHA